MIEGIKIMKPPDLADREKTEQEQDVQKDCPAKPGRRLGEAGGPVVKIKITYEIQRGDEKKS